MEKEDYGIYILLLTTLIIFIESLKKYTFSIIEINLTYNILLLPFTFLLINTITKKYGYKKGFIASILSSILLIIFKSLIAFSLGERILFSNIIEETISYMLSQIINIIIYNFLQSNTKNSYQLIFLNYILSVVSYHMFLTLTLLNTITLEKYWKEYFITLGIQIIICIPISFLEKKLIRKKITK